MSGVAQSGQPLPATEGADPAFDAFDTWPVSTQLGALWQSQLAAAAIVSSALPALSVAAEAALPCLRNGGRLIYAGAGSSGRLAAQDGAELEPTYNWPPERLLLLIAGGPGALLNAVENAEDDEVAARAAVREAAIGPDDVLVGVAASGRTPYTVAAVEAARSAGALTIGIANVPETPLLLGAACPVFVGTGAEPIAGSTRMKAGTAQKIVLNLLSTTLMTGLGRVYRAQMVDMRSRNAKLRRRAVRMVMGLAACPEATARIALEQTDGHVKPAVLIARGTDRDEALAALSRNSDNLRNAINELGLASSRRDT
ncbi:N-acetylmuramic acid 6-phosphate etherase [Acetobacter oeni]|uniref:N-acetylmuramic acid 6-phosphate etherase n=1 Tax=Acetobacter oeni TaxID=304077 RepID=A0A511XHE7_9PROT|nr:N-acetylmuramic acid 6-phosphate etherase [Acetobacter oeni]MBB3881210.1 N-acetylmuramic acid 6-phosphate etherase [Acetobacter oeni]NHO18086.1 N-acetylmuramic acid 6-phosphate etherase [Acetobacter oeni]GBR08349.1 N-acetylmuramic acid 6-phosphate etherase [Acetobacter oeni LMG 21952]GEN62362.1 N-acetylmuramic acid 6-phosphate etherase [Acetobacter oeni]